MNEQSSDSLNYLVDKGNKADATIWAEEFVYAFHQRYGLKIDKDWMTGWFANAIMAGWDEAERSRSTENKG